ncbi:MAG: glycerate kinase [Phascolarctobacterium sp.]|nr:glycerate kinase [Phascolarctobacterium sp.]
MPKFVLIPDSYKGTLSSKEVCAVMAGAIEKRFPGSEVVSIPVADGGEGTVDAFLSALKGERISLKVTGPLWEPVTASYAFCSEGIAVIEMAAAAGLPLVGKKLDVGGATTYGVGELIDDAIKRGARKIILGLGGSATNDGGCGAAAALGAIFRKSDHTTFVPTGATLKDIASIDMDVLRTKFANIELQAMCDINNPLCGPLGAAAVFGPQKGATPEQVALLDQGLKHLAALLLKATGRNVDELPGAGAAGGMGAGAAAFFQGELVPGIEAVLDTVGFDKIIADADYIFTGEGCLDEQSFMGKVLSGVLKRAKQANVPVIAVAGGIKALPPAAYEQGLMAAFSISTLPIPLAEAAPRSKDNLALVMDNILRMMKIF